MSNVAGSYSFRTFKIGGTDLTKGNLQMVKCNIYESCVDHHTYADVTVFDPDDKIGRAHVWTPVTYVEFETDKNEYNKTIRVLDSDYKDVIVENLKDLLK